MAHRHRPPQADRPLACVRARASRADHRRPGRAGAGRGPVGRATRRDARSRGARCADQHPPRRTHPALPRRAVGARGRTGARPHRARHGGAAGSRADRVPAQLRGSREGRPAMTDAFDALRIPDAPASPDLEFASGLRARIEGALLAPRELPMSVTEATTTDVAAPSQSPSRPPTQHTITPYLAAADARAAVDFYVDAFGAVQRGEPIEMPDGRIGHVEIVVGDSVLMLADEYPEL